MKQTNQSYSPWKTSQSISVEWRTCDREMVKQFFWWKPKTTFVVSKIFQWIKWGTPKIYISTRFHKYLSYLEVQKSSKVDITKKEVFSKSVIKTLSGSKFLVSEYIFKLVYHCEGSRWSEICCARDIAKKSLNRLLLLLILKSS